VSAPSTTPESVDTVRVEFPATEGYRSVGRLVLGGLASRFELPVDRLEDLLLAVESLLMRGVDGSTVTLEVDADDSGFRVRVGPFATASASDPLFMRVLPRLVDEAAYVASENTAASFAELVVIAARQRRSG
jgi:hypothetical protein